jgi:hypothetical protein
MEGLPQDFELTISLISGKFGSISIEEVTTLLLGHEARLERFRKQALRTCKSDFHCQHHYFQYC